MVKRIAVAVGLAVCFPSAPAAPAAYPTFEGHQVHPLDVTCSRAKLLAVNTPDARL